jgi:2-oxoglutarate dehydrogenase E2 component (dihydrolipoamide succinyltransferase)
MAQTEIILPALGEGIIEAEITRWLVAEGERVEPEQPLVEIATDKVDSEVQTAHPGILGKILIGEGETAKIGQVLAILETGTEASSRTTGEDSASTGRIADPGRPATSDTPPGRESGDQKGGQSGVTTLRKDVYRTDPSRTLFLSPAVKNLIRKHGIGDEELLSIKGTGRNGRIILSDIWEYLDRRGIADSGSRTGEDGAQTQEDGAQTQEDGSPGEDAEPGQPVGPVPEELIYGGPENEVIEMDRMRRIIARHMSYSKQVSPHVNSFIETDVTDLVFLRESIKDSYLEKHGQKLTLTPMILVAVIRALKDYPRINASVDGEKIILKKSINIGMAAALPDGNLIVPVIRDADKLSFSRLVATVNDLAGRSRSNSLQPEEVRGGTFTVTNLGPFGSLTGTPIINQPEAAILALGAIRKKPAVLETGDGEAIGIRHLMIMCLAYDHRIIDGALGGMFLKRISDILENELPETGL